MCNGNQDKNKELGAPDVQSNEKNYQLTENELGEIAAGQNNKEVTTKTQPKKKDKKSQLEDILKKIAPQKPMHGVSMYAVKPWEHSKMFVEYQKAQENYQLTENELGKIAAGQEKDEGIDKAAGNTKGKKLQIDELLRKTALLAYGAQLPPEQWLKMIDKSRKFEKRQKDKDKAEN